MAPSQAKAFIDASVEPLQPRGFRVRIAVSADSDVVLGVRELVEDTADCEQVADAAALAIALMIDPNAGAHETEPVSVAAEPSASPAVAPPEPVCVAARTEPAPRTVDQVRHWRARAGISALGAVGQLPRLAWGVLGSVRLSPPQRRFGLDVLVMYLGQQRAELRADAGGHFAAGAAGVAGWWAPLRRDRLAVSLGAGAHLGGIAASGFGFTAQRNYAQSWLLDAALDLDVAWTALPPWGVLARASLGFPLWRDAFEVTQGADTQVIFRPSRVVGFLSLGLSFEP